MLDIINKTKTYGKYDLIKDLNDEIDNIADDIANFNVSDEVLNSMESRIVFKKELIKQILTS